MPSILYMSDVDQQEQGNSVEIEVAQTAVSGGPSSE
jgi:hypothetical protein